MSMVEQATFVKLKVEFENMVMSMLIINSEENHTSQRYGLFYIHMKN